MTSLADLLQQGTAHAWLFIPTAILLGALHGLEPGHSKTMMAAFVIAVRGTVLQAVILGLSAAISHTAVVWLVALGGQYLGRGMNVETTEPYFQITSAIIVATIALWMIWRTRRDVQNANAGDHHHHHHDDMRTIDTGHGIIKLEIFEDGQPARFRIRFARSQRLAAKDITITTERPDGSRQTFAFAERVGHLESCDDIPEPHAFTARLLLNHGDHAHHYDVTFEEDAHTQETMTSEDAAYMDAHERAHASDIERRFGNRPVTTPQIVLFGLTGGLIPCPAAITVLILCLQIKQLSLGVVLVLCFSIGLAITMVSAGVAASLSIKHIQKRWNGFDSFARRAPYASGLLMLAIALYMGFSGWLGLHVQAETALRDFLSALSA
jgi:nickel/cobalt transporter (NicO) family protein